MGDLKLFALSSLPLGTVQRSFDALLIACALGLLAALVARKRVIPFAPALLLGTLCTLASG